MSDGASERGNDRARQDSQAQMMRWREMGGVEVGGRAAKAVQGWGMGMGVGMGRGGWWWQQFTEVVRSTLVAVDVDVLFM